MMKGKRRTKRKTTFQSLRPQLVIQSLTVSLITGGAFALLSRNFDWLTAAVAAMAGAACYRISQQYIVELLSKVEAIRRFDQDMAHELAIPITTLQTRLQLIARQQDTQQQTQHDIENHLAMLSAATDRLSELVHDYRVISASEHIDKSRLSFIRVDHLVRRLANEMTPLFSGKAIEVRFAQLEPATMVGNIEGIKRMISNLFSNALRYGRTAGCVDISVYNSPYQIHLTIEDNGRGIAPEHLPHLFDRFYRVIQSNGEEESGSGLGLAIVKAVVDAHNGSVTVSSEPEQGTTFEITLPKWTEKQFLPLWTPSNRRSL